MENPKHKLAELFEDLEEKIATRAGDDKWFHGFKVDLLGNRNDDEEDINIIEIGGDLNEN